MCCMVLNTFYVLTNIQFKNKNSVFDNRNLYTQSNEFMLIVLIRIQMVVKIAVYLDFIGIGRSMPKHKQL